MLLFLQVNEVRLLEESSRHMGKVQASWLSMGNVLDQQCISQSTALSSARSLLDKLPDPKLGSQSAKIGDPSTLSRAVVETEGILTNSATRLKQTQTTASIWRNISNCKINVKSAELNTEGVVIPLELNERTKEDMVCLLFALSKLLESRAKNSTDENNTSNSIENNKNMENNSMPSRNGKISPEQELSEIVKSSSNKKVSKPMTSGCAYCFFDLMQGHVELGRVIMEVNCKAAPKMAKNFIDLCTGAHGFGYLNTKLWRISSGDHVDGGDIPEGGQCSIFDKKPFLGDASNLQDGLGMLRMRGRGTSEDGQPIVGAQFMVWIKARKFKNYSRTLVFGQVKDGLDILTNMPETRQRKGKPFVPPVTIIKSGIME